MICVCILSFRILCQANVSFFFLLLLLFRAIYNEIRTTYFVIVLKEERKNNSHTSEWTMTMETKLQIHDTEIKTKINPGQRVKKKLSKWRDNSFARAKFSAIYMNNGVKLRIILMNFIKFLRKVDNFSHACHKEQRSTIRPGEFFRFRFLCEHFEVKLHHVKTIKTQICRIIALKCHRQS